MSLKKMVHEIFKQGGFPDDSVEERHFGDKCTFDFDKIKENQYSFSMFRHPSPIGWSRPRGIGMPFFVEVERFFILDTEKESITPNGSKTHRVVVNYEQLAEEDVENTLDWSRTQLEKFPKREDAVKYIEEEAESLNWQDAINSGIGDLDFIFDWDKYLSIVKKLFIEEMIRAWDESDHLKLVD